MINLLKKLYILLVSACLIFSSTAYAGKINETHSSDSAFETLNDDVRGLSGTLSKVAAYAGFAVAVLNSAIKFSPTVFIPSLTVGLAGAYGPSIIEASYSAEI